MPAEEWTRAGSIRGADGAPGADGADGPPGPPGAPGPSGQRTPTTLADNNSVTPDYHYDMNIVPNTQAAGTMTINTPNSSEVGALAPAEGRSLLLRIKTTNAMTLVFSSAYRASSFMPMPTGTTAGKTMYVGFVRNAIDSFWDLTAVIRDF